MTLYHSSVLLLPIWIANPDRCRNYELAGVSCFRGTYRGIRLVGGGAAMDRGNVEINIDGELNAH